MLYYWALRASRDYPRTSAMDSDNRSFGDMFRDPRANNHFMTMPPPMIVHQQIGSDQKVPPRTIQSSQHRAPQVSKQTIAVIETFDSIKVLQFLI